MHTFRHGLLMKCAYTCVGVGPAKAITLIRQYKSIEEILKHTKVCCCKISNLQCTVTGLETDSILHPS